MPKYIHNESQVDAFLKALYDQRVLHYFDALLGQWKVPAPKYPKTELRDDFVADDFRNMALMLRELAYQCDQIVVTEEAKLAYKEANQPCN